MKRLNFLTYLITSILMLAGTPHLFCQPGSGQKEQGSTESLLFRKVTLPFHSTILNQELELQVSLPVYYYRSDKKYPVVFCTDGNRSFDMISNIAFILSFPGQEIPEAVVVGIGYKIAGLEDWATWRHRDLTPTRVPEADQGWRNTLIKMTADTGIEVHSGDAKKFLTCLISEVIPFIESTYRVNQDRILMGYSLGGLFCLYALFETPETFQRYFAGSPSIGWDNKILFRYEENYAGSHNDLPVKLFMSCGELEGQNMLNNMLDMEKRLNARAYPSLIVQSQVFEKETHASCYAAATGRAFKVLFGK